MLCIPILTAKQASTSPAAALNPPSGKHAVLYSFSSTFWGNSEFILRKFPIRESESKAVFYLSGIKNIPPFAPPHIHAELLQPKASIPLQTTKTEKISMKFCQQQFETFGNDSRRSKQSSGFNTDRAGNLNNVLPQKIF